ncbi:c-type cytochrome [Rhodobacter ferrooxidans]|uniref:Gluconate 2-dehydrogenase (Acceptor) n=1 Tax=Rhodobacter ferrooxidans TaxID=371731 RepID=C8RZ10_9RHOB|nr:cytochrome c [Rhodobacter sp. SW2]EEW25967.1 gluconate 2-dehydrogenase (acceptor) [Rhodobacter sp. SW2]
MKRLFLGLCLLGVIGAAGFVALTRPARIDPAAVAGLVGDPKNGEIVFWVGGCASCHAADKSTGDAMLLLTGGKRFDTEFGVFVAPNISPDPAQGIGGWSVEDLANAMLLGTSPRGTHYYPAFPYASYVHIKPQDVADLKAFMDTLPPSSRPTEPNELNFPFNFRLLMGGWKFLFLNPDPIVADAGLTPAELRGRDLVEGLGHCGECHSPRNPLGGIERANWLAGAPNPDGPGKIPNITPAKLNWSQADIVEYLTSGFTPSFDSAGAAMADVVNNLSHVPASDREAIAAYLKKVPAIE